jgi:hypothetical protein
MRGREHEASRSRRRSTRRRINLQIQLMGQTAFKDQLKSDSAFWVACENEWGRGQGYKVRVSGHNSSWFAAAQRLELEGELRSLIEREWDQTLRRVTALFDDE